MVILDFLVMCGVFGFSAFGFAMIQSSGKASRKREARMDAMHEDFKKALAARDYRKLDDFLLLYSDLIDAGVKKQIDIRRDELFIEKNP